MTQNFRCEDFVKLAMKAKGDDDLKAKLHENPLAYLDSVGVVVEDCFRDVVEQQIKLITKGRRAGTVDQPPAGSFVFATNDWGVVLVIDEQGMHWLEDASVAMISKAIRTALEGLSASSSNPIVGALVLMSHFWCATQAVWLLAEYGLVAAMDKSHHKGVYLTWSWLGLALACYVPFPTPITAD